MAGYRLGRFRCQQHLAGLHRYQPHAHGHLVYPVFLVYAYAEVSRPITTGCHVGVVSYDATLDQQSSEYQRFQHVAYLFLTVIHLSGASDQLSLLDQAVQSFSLHDLEPCALAH